MQVGVGNWSGAPRLVPHHLALCSRPCQIASFVLAFTPRLNDRRGEGAWVRANPRLRLPRPSTHRIRPHLHIGAQQENRCSIPGLLRPACIRVCRFRYAQRQPINWALDCVLLTPLSGSRVVAALRTSPVIPKLSGKRNRSASKVPLNPSPARIRHADGARPGTASESQGDP
jgi:hypothetical protein